MKNLIIFNTVVYILFGASLYFLVEKDILPIIMSFIGWLIGNCIIWVNRKYLK